VGPVGVVVGLGLVLSSCGGSAPDSTAATTSTLPSLDGRATSSSQPALPAGTATLPDVTVDDVAGAKVRLSSLTPSSQPTLIWFWAPH
jgi:hypothetical protein